MRIETVASEIVPGDMVWFGGARKPTVVTEVLVQDGVQKLAVLKNDSTMWYLPYDTGIVYKYEPDAPEPEVEIEERVFLDPDGNQT